MPARYWCNPDDGHDWTACSSCAYPPTPQHDKLKPHQEAANTIGQFLEWLDSTKYFIAEWVGDVEAFPAHRPVETWIGEYFGIDVQAYHKEKAAVLKWVQAQYE